MKTLIAVVLLGLLQGGLPEAFFGKVPPSKVSVVVSGPFGKVSPIVQEYYRKSSSSGYSQRGRPNRVSNVPGRRSSFSQYDYFPSFDRGHVESHPLSFQDIVLKDAGTSSSQYKPLREAVEHIPIEGEMNIILRSTDDEADDSPFSRSHVEAFPSPLAPYPPNSHNVHATLYSATEDGNEFYPTIGYRGDVESYPSTPNTNPFTYFRGAQPETYSAEDQWGLGVYQEPRPLLYKVWGNQQPLRTSSPDKKIVCYYESWAVYRPAPLDFDIKDIDPFSCTHLIYSFAGLHKENLTITSLDHERDVVKGAYKSAVALKGRNPDLKVMIAVGGWAEGGANYSRMVSSPENRTRFVKSVVEFLEEHRFDGLDFDWEYPGATDRGGKHTDKENVVLLLEELREAFKIKEWLLTMAVPIAESRITDGYDLSRMSLALDFFNVMVYDLRGPWDGYADHHAPIDEKTTDQYIHTGLNLRDGIRLFLREGVPKEKMVIGIPFYGRSFTLTDPTQTSPGSPISTVGKAGKYTQEPGYIAYYEICMNQRNGGWKIVRDEKGGPYMTKDDQWIGYDDEKHIEAKVNLIRNEGLGGVMIWAIDLDDYLNMCGGVRWPLLSTIRRSLHVPKKFAAKKPSTPQQVTEGPPTTTETTTRETSSDMEPSVVEEVADSQDSSPTLTSGEPMEGGSCQGGASITEDPYDCGSYLTCIQGKYIKSPCGTGLHFNRRKKVCDWPKNANCKAKRRRPTPAPGSISQTETHTTEPTSSPIHPPASLEPAPSAGPLSGDYMVVCYFTNWAWYRPGSGKYTPDDIDESICTHIVYGFAVLDYSNLVIKPHDAWADIDNGFYEKVTALRAKGIKVTIAIGGWNDSAGDKYSRLVGSPSSRSKFIQHVITFIKKHNFDGLDLDWEYPVCWQVDCEKGPPSDKENFGLFVKELSMAFRRENLLLSAAVSPSKKVIDEGYDVPVLNQYLDWIAVMTYDFHGHWDKKTGHVAPLYHHPEDDYDYFNMDFAIRYWIEKGASKRKIVLGMPLYGQAFTLNDPSVNGLNAPANQKGKAGQFTRAAGFLAYYEICENIRNGWTVVRDPQGRMGPYAYMENQWVSFDDVATIRKKSEYIREMGLGGGMVWALDLDDFTNRCGQGRHPLMKTIQSVLGPAMDGATKIHTPPGTQTQPETEPDQQYPTVETGISTGVVPGTTTPPEGYKVVCYYTNWSWYRQGEGKFFPEDVDPSLCTHINYGFVVLDKNTLTLKPHDSWADIDNNFYQRVTDLKKHGAKVLVALGGWNDSKGPKYSDLANSPSAREKFNKHALVFIEKFNFDGLDLDWEYPKCWQVDCSKGPDSDKQAFSAWIMELNALFKPRGLLLTAAVSPSYKVIDLAYDVPVLSKYLDFINVMTYDYFGQWDKQTGHVSPMYPHPEVQEKKFNTDFTIKYWIQKGADPKKLILGMPMYGQSFTLAQTKNKGLNQKSYGGGEAGTYTRARGFLAYYEICYYIKHNSWVVVRDPLGTMGPYAHKGNQWVGFDDIPQIRYKSNYVKKEGLGGAMIWALDLDDFKDRCGCETYPLLKTINRVLRNYPPLPQECPLLGGGAVKVFEQPKVTSSTTTTTQRPHTPFTRAPVTSFQTVPEPVAPAEGVPGDVGTEGASCKEGEFKSHSSCGKFYECYKGKLQVVSCFPGLHHDGKGKCTSTTMAGCTEKRVNPPTSPVAEKPIVPARPIQAPIWPSASAFVREVGYEGAPCKSGEFKSHADCGKFYECMYGKLKERQCFPGLHWDGEGRCTWPDQVNCQSQPESSPPIIQPVTQEATRSTTTTTTTTTSTTTPWTPVTRYTTPRRSYSTPATPTIPPWRPVTEYSTTPSTTTSVETTTQQTSTRWYVPWTPSTEPTTPRPTHPPGSLEIDGYKVVCYFTNWAWYRRGIAKYKPEDIDPDLCTHVIYGFAVLDANRLLIKPHDTWADYDNKFYQKVTSLKAKGIRVLVAIGGWNDSKGGKYSQLVNSPGARAAFVEHVVQFIEKHNFDGLDLDWEYPKCWQVDCEKGPASDKDGFSAWMRELKAAFEPRNWLLTAAISPSAKVIKHAYHVPDLTRYLDFVNVMTYDYHGHWDKQTGHVAPMFYHPESTNPEFNANYTINYLIDNGADRRKLIMGMPLYGQAFSLLKPEDTGLNSPARKGQAGEFTRAAGFLAYYEICDRVAKGYTVVKDPSGSIGPYAYKGNQWVGFDDANMIRFKSEFVKNMGLGGGMIWALDLDDFGNRCSCEPHPLLRTINRVLRNYPSTSVDCSLG